MIPSNLKMSQPPLFQGAVCAYPYSETLAQRFTVPGRFEDQEPMRLWTRFEQGGQDLIGLPWHCCPQAEDDRRVDGWKIFLKTQIDPRPGQADAIEQSTALLKAGVSHQLRAPTGSGKTVLALQVIANVGVSTCVIVPKEDLIDQWIERILQYTDLKPRDIGRLQQSTIDVRGRPIVIGSLQSLAKPDKYPQWVVNNFGLIVADECHRLGADLLGEVARLFPARLRFGLSATPKRTDGKELAIEAHIGPERVVIDAVQLSPKVLRVKSEWVCPRDKLGNQVPHSPGRIALVMKSIVKNQKRNQLICRAIGAAYEKGRKIVIFSSQLDHLEILEDMVQGYGVPLAQIGRYYGAAKKEQLKQAGSRRVIFATWQKMAEGTDIPDIDTAVLAGPQANVQQAVGRILRLHPTKKPPVVIDIVDNDSPVLAGYAKKRIVVYKILGSEILDAAFPAAA